MNICERLKSPVLWVTILTSVYTYVETADFTCPKCIILSVLGILITALGAFNNPTDRDRM